MQEASATPSPFRVPLPATSVFDRLDAEARASLEAELAWFSLPGGRVLYRERDAPTGIYMVLTGCLGIIVGSVTHDEPAFLVQVGEVVGEYASLLDRPQAATCIAIRDTSLAWLSQEGFDRLMLKHPASVLPFAAQLIDLFNRALSFRRRVFTAPKILAIVPLHPNVPVEPFAAAIVAAIVKSGRRATLLNSMSAQRRPDVIQAIESEHDVRDLLRRRGRLGLDADMHPAVRPRHARGHGTASAARPSATAIGHKGTPVAASRALFCSTTMGRLRRRRPSRG